MSSDCSGCSFNKRLPSRSLDVVVSHPDVSQLTVTVTAPSGTSIVVHDGTVGGADLSLNYPRQRLVASGSMEDFHGEEANGIWSLQVVDGADGDTGRLMSWALNVNEGYQDGSLFVGNDLEVDGVIRSRSGVEIGMGGDLIVKNSSGEETFKVNGEIGFNPRLTCISRGLRRSSSSDSRFLQCADEETMVSAACNETLEYSGEGARCRNGNQTEYYNFTARCCKILF